jgi:glycosyltransferase involved in cell wall biosynthesis
MKITVVTPHFPPNYVGGVERYAQLQAEWLTRHGQQVDVVCVERLGDALDHVTASVEFVDGYNVHRVTAGFNAGRNFRLRWAHRAFREWFVELFEQTQPDVVHVHSGYLVGEPALNAARELRIPTVVTLHDYWFICPQITLLQPDGTSCTGPDDAAKCAWCLQTERRRFRLADGVTGGAAGAVARALIRRSLAGRQLRNEVTRRSEGVGSLLAHADLVFSPSEFLRTQLIRAGAPAARILVEPCGVRPIRRRNTTITDSPLRLGYVGRIVEAKGVHVLVEAVAQLPFADWQLHIHGPLEVDPRYTDRLKRMAAGDPRIHFEGAFAASRIDEVFDGFDVLIVPSIWYENRPFVILEGLSAGLIVVASRLGGMAELIAHEQNGLLFRPGDAQNLADTLTRLRQEPALEGRLHAFAGAIRTQDEEMSAILAAYHRVKR